MGRGFSADLKKGDVVGLSGDLGAGKTTFIQGLAEGLGVTGRINSPTFIIMRSYGDFYHADLFRLEGDLKREVANVGLLDIIAGGQAVVVIEWAERISEHLPKSTKWVSIENMSENKRRIKIQ